MFDKFKKLIKFLIGSPRIAPTAGKTLLYIWLKKDLKNLKGSLGVDLGGGKMQNRKLFATNQYVCVDVNKSELDLGLAQNPDAIAECSRMQDFMKNNQLEKADFLLCVQTMGANSSFEHDETYEVVKQMYNFLKPKGNMIFNVGSTDTNLKQSRKQIFKFLDGKFKSLNVKDYGAFHKTSNDPKHPLLILFLAYLMKYFFPLRDFFGFKKKKIYFVCKYKL